MVFWSFRFVPVLGGPFSSVARGCDALSEPRLAIQGIAHGNTVGAMEGNGPIKWLKSARLH
jgi:hypothetical protein